MQELKKKYWYRCLTLGLQLYLEVMMIAQKMAFEVDFCSKPKKSLVITQQLFFNRYRPSIFEKSLYCTLTFLMLLLMLLSLI